MSKLTPGYKECYLKNTNIDYSYNLNIFSMFYILKRFISLICSISFIFCISLLNNKYLNIIKNLSIL